MDNEIVLHEYETIDAINTSDLTLVGDPPLVDEAIRVYEAHLERIIQQFLHETHQLAEGHHFLYSNQVQFAERQEAALLAVHSHAQNNAEELAAHQQRTVEQLELELANVRESLQQQLMAFANAQVERTQEAQANMEANIRAVLDDAQHDFLAIQELVSGRADQTAAAEMRVQMALQALREDVSDQFREYPSQSQVEEQLRAQREAIISQIGESADQRQWSSSERTAFEESTAQLEEQVERKMQALLLAARREIAADVEERVQASAIDLRSFVASANQAAEERLEARLHQVLHKTQADMATGIERQEVAISEAEERLEARLRELLRNAQAGMTSGIERQEAVISDVERRLLESRVFAEEAYTTLEHRVRALEGNQAEDVCMQDVTSEESNSESPPSGASHPSRQTNTTAQRSSRRSCLSAEQVTQLDGLERRLNAQIQQILTVKTGPERVRRRAKSIKKIIAKAQQDVAHRGEVAARYYEIRAKLMPQSSDGNIEED